MKRRLIIFIDGMSFDYANNNLHIMKDLTKHSISPGFGFSNNIYPELICGLSPDKIGYFNEWSPVIHPKKNFNILLLFFDLFRNFLYINAFIRKIILRKLFKIETANIPFKYLNFFKPQGSHNFRDLPHDNNLLHLHNFRIHDGAESNNSLGKKDLWAFNSCECDYSENIFLSLVDFDNLCHVYGIDSEQVSNHIVFLNLKIQQLLNRLNNEANLELIVFSDHGMASVNNVVNFNIESKFGPMNVNRYLYFIDSTFLRVWINDPTLIQSFHIYLSSLPFGELISSEDRIKYGVSNKNFATFMFRANEGVMFVPNFYGSRANKAMHGYSSDLTSQKAFFAYSATANKLELKPKSSVDVYFSLSSILNDKKES